MDLNSKELNGEDKKHIGKKAIIIIVILAVIASIILVAVTRKPKAKEVSLSTVEKRDLSQVITASGNIEPVNIQTVTPPMQQKVAKVYVKEGQKVKKGDPLFKLDTADIEYQLNKSNMSLKSMQNSINGAEKLNSNSIKQAEIGYNKAKDDYAYTKSKYDKAQDAYNKGALPKDEVDNIKKTLNDASKQVDLAKIQLDNAKTNQSEEGSAAAQKQQAESLKLDIENLKKKINESTYTSDISGKVLKVGVKEGEFAKTDATGATDNIIVCDNSLYKLNISLSQYDSTKLSTGQKATIKVKGIDTAYLGNVSKIAPMADVIFSGTNKETKVQATIDIKNADEHIKVGYEADADIVVKELPDIIAVNFEAVKTENNGKKYVFVSEDGKAVKRYIETGIEGDFDIEVLNGIAIGDKVVANPTEDLKDGDLMIDKR